jgi:hypothetical protein
VVTDVRDVYESVSNWGRWGEDDQRGALNLVTSECVAAAAHLVVEGRHVGCGRVDEVPSALNSRPPVHHMIAAGDVQRGGCGFATDYIGIAPHGPTTTHIDALCHAFFDGVMYNGRSASLVPSTGARVNSIAALADGVTTRGVLLDIPALRGVDYLEPGDSVHAVDLDAAASAAGIEPRPGDALVVRVGREPRRQVLGVGAELTDGGALNLPGLDADCLPWLYEHGIALLASDGGNDALPWPQVRERLPIHVGCLVFMGVHLVDNLYTEPLTQACQDLQRWEFLFTFAPLAFQRATASVLNPTAIF